MSLLFSAEEEELLDSWKLELGLLEEDESIIESGACGELGPDEEEASADELVDRDPLVEDPPVDPLDVSA
ncbi:unnamed protein product [Linum trigynum]|uniref:Uncharacterized protein n=1 Tax=Linum trigynum TaxID=586398 RepID=A0AAV2F5W2_9ROSI